MTVIGRQFIACWRMKRKSSPRGTIESIKIMDGICSRQVHANRPYGTIFSPSSMQAINCLPTINSPHGLKMWVMISLMGGTKGWCYIFKLIPLRKGGIRGLCFSRGYSPFSWGQVYNPLCPPLLRGIWGLFPLLKGIFISTISWSA